MGRGRQKAKQTKVARQLKYFSPDTDYNALQRELAGSEDHPDVEAQAAEVEDESDEDESDEYDEADEYADWAAEPRG